FHVVVLHKGQTISRYSCRETCLLTQLLFSCYLMSCRLWPGFRPVGCADLSGSPHPLIQTSTRPSVERVSSRDPGEAEVSNSGARFEWLPNRQFRKTISSSCSQEVRNG